MALHVGWELVLEFEVPLVQDKSESETVHETVQGSQQKDRSGVSLFASNFCTAFFPANKDTSRT